MAIKRSVKSKGSASSKAAVASAPLRHAEVRPAQQMVVGEVYVGWLCKNRSCGQVIAIVGAVSGEKVSADFGEPLTAIKCPHCKDEDLYRWSGRGEFKHAGKGYGSSG